MWWAVAVFAVLAVLEVAGLLRRRERRAAAVCAVVSAVGICLLIWAAAHPYDTRLMERFIQR